MLGQGGGEVQKCGSRGQLKSVRGCDATTTIINNTTTSFVWPNPERVSGYTVEILDILERYGIMTCSEIAEKLGKSQRYVRRYLYNMEKYGFLCRSSPFWSITPKGSFFLQKYLGKKLSRQTGILRKKERRKKEERKKKDSYKTVLMAIVARRASSRPNLPKEVVVIMAEVASSLYEHYKRTGRKGLIFRDAYEAAEYFGIGYDDLREALRELYNSGICYAVPLGRNLKIGLKKRFIEELEGGARDPA